MRITARQRRWLKSMATVASTTVHLGRHTSPIGWASAAMSLVGEILGEDSQEPGCFPRCAWSARAAICEVATRAELGKVISVDDGDKIREHDGCRFGYSLNDGREWVYGPAGDSTVLPRFIWEHLGSSIHVVSGAASRSSTLAGMTLRSDRLQGDGCGAVGIQAAKEIGALMGCKKPVGALFEGVRGGGKSWTMRSIAKSIGGFSLRARLGEVNGDSFLDLMDVLAPKTVIFDDIDRGDTSQALDLIEQIVDHGVVVLASCNRTDEVDDSLIRARRLGLHYTLGGIDLGLLEQMTRGYPISEEAMVLLRTRTVAEVSEFLDHMEALEETRALELLTGRQVGGRSVQVLDRDAKRMRS